MAIGAVTALLNQGRRRSGYVAQDREALEDRAVDHRRVVVVGLSGARVHRRARWQLLGHPADQHLGRESAGQLVVRLVRLVRLVWFIVERRR
jgi:hypothetical protein